MIDNESEVEQPKPKKKDDFAGLFELNRDELLDTQDVIKVDVDRDILDVGVDGTLDDLVQCSEEDIMGNIYGQTPLEAVNTRRFKKKKLIQQQKQTVIYPSYPPPTQIGRIGS